MALESNMEKHELTFIVSVVLAQSVLNPKKLFQFLEALLSSFPRHVVTMLMDDGVEPHEPLQRIPQ